MICSINGWELTQQDGNIVVLDYDGFKVGEFNSEAEAKDLLEKEMRKQKQVFSEFLNDDNIKKIF